MSEVVTVPCFYECGVVTIIDPWLPGKYHINVAVALAHLYKEHPAWHGQFEDAFPTVSGIYPTQHR